MKLDVLVPTLTRAPLLEQAVRSLLTARVPSGLEVLITVIHSHCTDDTGAVVERLIGEFPGRLQLVVERRRGKSRALNAGIAATTGDLVGMIAGDEEVDVGWFEVVARAFADTSIDYIGGPYVPRWDTPPPEWLRHEYRAVFGAAENGHQPREYGAGFPGILKGGNAVIRRRISTPSAPTRNISAPPASRDSSRAKTTRCTSGS